jgi:hypothetical protein
MDDLIFTLDDVQKIRKVSVNIEDFDIYAREAQITWLEKVLGVKLYNELLNDLASARMQILLNGEVYQDEGIDINYRGLKNYLCYVWLYLYSLESDIAVTPIGTMLFKDEQAERKQKDISAKAAQTNYLTSAESNERMILNYLNSKREEYPEFSESKEIKVAKKTNNTFKTFGNSYEPPNNIW